MPDVFLGRWPVSNIQELKNIINKTIFMEMNLPIIEKQSTFIAGEGNLYMQMMFERGHDTIISNTFQPYGYQCVYLHQPPHVDIEQELSNNPRYFIYSGHGSINSWAVSSSNGLNNNTLNSATNTKFPFAYAFACNTGNFSDTSNIGKKWIVKQNKGGVTYLGSSVNTMCHSDYIIETKIFDSDYSDYSPISSVINHGKNEYRKYFWAIVNRKRTKRYLRSYNLLGDPSICANGVGCLNNVYFYYNEFFPNGAYTEYHVSNEIKNFNTFHVNNGACVHLQAGSEIILNNGFYAAEGSDFTAVIAPCNSRNENQLEFIPDNNTETSQNQDIESVKLIQDNHSDIESNGMLIFPNPANQTFTISFTEAQESVKQVRVMDMLGKEVLRYENPSSNTFNIAHLPVGTYIVQVISISGKEYASKLVKK